MKLIMSEGMKFYDGTDVTPEDVIASIQYGLDGSDWGYGYSNIESMEADGKDVTDVSNVFVGQDWEQTTTEDGLAHTQEKLPTELYLSGSRAVVVSAYSDWTDTGSADDTVTGFGQDYVAVDIYDVTDPSLVGSLVRRVACTPRRVGRLRLQDRLSRPADRGQRLPRGHGAEAAFRRSADL